MKMEELIRKAHDLNEVLYLSMMIGPLSGILGNSQKNARTFLCEKFQQAIIAAKTIEEERAIFNLWVAITGEVDSLKMTL